MNYRHRQPKSRKPVGSKDWMLAEAKEVEQTDEKLGHLIALWNEKGPEGVSATFSHINAHKTLVLKIATSADRWVADRFLACGLERELIAASKGVLIRVKVMPA